MLRKLITRVLARAVAKLDAVRARFSSTIKLTAAAAGMMLAAALLGLLGAIGFGVAAGLALAIVIPAWAAALVIAAMLIMLTAAVAAAARATFRTASWSRTDRPPKPETNQRKTPV